jgi:hypothetical protein
MFNANDAVREIDTEISRLQKARTALAGLASVSAVRTSGRGGARPGAGRPKGSGRQGSSNRGRGRSAGHRGQSRGAHEGNGSKE